MLEKIYEVIKNNKSVTFEEVHQQFSRTIRSRKDFSGYLANLEANNKIMYFNQRYYDLEQFPKVEGFINWNMTGFCWLTPEHQTNEYGIAFDSRDDLNAINNKKRAFLGHKAIGRQVTIDDRSFVFIEDAIPAQDTKLIATYKQKQQEWIVINGQPIFNIRNDQVQSSPEFQNLVNGAQEGEIAEFTYGLDGSMKMTKHFGNINKFGMETLIIKTLSGVKSAPLNTNSIERETLQQTPEHFYTIDSIYTKDIDDAIFIEKTDSGWKLQVAIADVSSFVKPNDKQDTHAQSNAISYYFPHEVMNLLDRGLAEEFCSLNPGTPKQSMICVINVNKDGSIASYDFKHSEIISHARLTYSDVDTLIEGGKPTESKFFNGTTIEELKSFDQIPQVKESLLQLHEFAKTQKFGRERDYFVVQTPEYDLDSFGKINHLFFRDENKPSQKMVENSMLVANICTAKFVEDKFKGLGIFRNQSAPLDGEFPKAAVYQESNTGHWGLDLPHYTHFTSPIRRYCDLVNHRLVKDAIYGREASYSAEEIKNISTQINKQQYVEKQIANKSKQMLLPQYIQRLQETNSLDGNIEIVDFSANGVVFRNPQLIEFFIPTFKVDENLKKEIQELKEDLSMQEKMDALSALNSKYQHSVEMGPFSWTDDRKNLNITTKVKQDNRLKM